jgi:uncharacterized protein
MSRLGLIDTREFARLGLVREGRLPVAGFARLASELCDSQGELSYRLQGNVDKRGQMGLELDFEVNVRVVCQRCLEPLELPLKVHNRFRLLDTAPEWTAEAAEFDAGSEDEIVATAAMDGEALIEDEVLLALPLVPRHENCDLEHGVTSGVRSGISSKAGGKDKVGRESPFGVLARLKDRAAK